MVYLAVFLDLLGFGIILPTLPYYALHFGVSGVWVGVLFTCYSLAQLIGAPILGRLSDRFGRRPVLLVSLAGSAIAFAASGFAEQLWTLMAARALAGLFGGSIATAQAYVADVTRPEERARYLGLIGASIGMGFVLGPFIGAELSRFGFSTAAFVSSGLCALNFLLALVLLRESRRAGDRPRQRVALGQALAVPAVARVLLAGFATTLAFVGMESTFALLGKQRFDLGPARLGRMFALVGVVIAVVQGGLVGRLVRSLGERTVAVLGAVILCGGLASLPWMPGLLYAGLMLAVVAAGQGLLLPSLSSLLSRESPAELQGGMMGVSQSLAAGARAAGPVLAGALFDRDIHLPYAVSALLVLGVALLLASGRKD